MKLSYSQIVYLLVGLIVITSVWFLLSLGIQTMIASSPDSVACSSQLSSAFGGVSALFSGLAFAGLLLSLNYQNKQLNTQAKQFKIQSKKTQDQQAINTIFQLINLHHEIVNKLEVVIKEEIQVGATKSTLKTHETIIKDRFEGRASLHHILTKFNDTVKKNSYGKEGLLTFKEVGQLYWKDHDFYHSTLAHYLRNLYHIFRYIDEESGLDEKDKHNYTSIVAAQLSADELGLIFYNSFLFEKSAKLYRKYRVFERVGAEPVIGNEEVIYSFNQVYAEKLVEAYPKIAGTPYKKLVNHLIDLLKQHIKKVGEMYGDFEVNIAITDDMPICKDLIRQRFFSGSCHITIDNEQIRERILENQKTFVFVFNINRHDMHQKDLSEENMLTAIENNEVVLREIFELRIRN